MTKRERRRALEMVHQPSRAELEAATRFPALQADYHGASPEQVAKALLRHQPKTERRE